MAKLLRRNNTELKFEDFDPVSELQDFPEKLILHVTIPGFRKEDFRVQVDALGRLSVKGQRQIENNKCRRFNKVFQLPPECDIEKIRGKFEGDVLSLTVPKKEKGLPPNEEIKRSKEEAEAKTKSEAKDGEKKEEESKPREETEQTRYKKTKEVKSKEDETDNKVKDELKTNAEKREESTEKNEETGMLEKKEESKTNAEKIEDSTEKKEETGMPYEKKEESKTNAEKIEDSTEKKEETGMAYEKKEESKTNAQKREESTQKKEDTGKPDNKEAAFRINDAINKLNQNCNSGQNKENAMKKSEIKKIISLKEKISQEVKDWSDYASLDNMLEVINRNKKEIVIAVAAFSIGVLVSRKLCYRK